MCALNEKMWGAHELQLRWRGAGELQLRCCGADLLQMGVMQRSRLASNAGVERMLQVRRFGADLLRIVWIVSVMMDTGGATRASEQTDEMG